MTRLLLSIFLASLLTICFSQETPVNTPVAILKKYQSAEQIYQQAEEDYLHNQDAPFFDTNK
jgi:hypothetical protein